MVEKEHKAEKFGQMWLSLVLVRMRKTHSDICIERKESQGKIRPGVIGVHLLTILTSIPVCPNILGCLRHTSAFLHIHFISSRSKSCSMCDIIDRSIFRIILSPPGFRGYSGQSQGINVKCQQTKKNLLEKLSVMDKWFTI